VIGDGAEPHRHEYAPSAVTNLEKRAAPRTGRAEPPTLFGYAPTTSAARCSRWAKLAASSRTRHVSLAVAPRKSLARRSFGLLARSEVTQQNVGPYFLATDDEPVAGKKLKIVLSESTGDLVSNGSRITSATVREQCPCEPGYCARVALPS